jgi:hypothetical protein
MKIMRMILMANMFLAMACSKYDDPYIADPLNVNQELFKSTLFIEIRDPSGTPVKGAKVSIGNDDLKTDVDGFILWKDATVGKTTYLTVSHENYFHASRKFYPSPGKTQYIKLIMLQNNRVGFFTASEGKTIYLGNDASLELPPDAYEDLSGKSYAGVVEVAAKVIKANDPDMSFKMPGDLIGIDTNGQTGCLASLGMVAVELRKPDGALLRLKKDFPATLRMQVEQAQLSLVPKTIPMWYFDEALGVWKEEGVAQLTADYYEAKVPHFSFWNFDAWFEVIKWGAKFACADSTAASQLKVCITIPELNTQKCEYTNEEGMVCGMVAANQLLQLDIYDDCGSPFYTWQIGPYSDSVYLQVDDFCDQFRHESQSRIQAFVYDCDGQPATNLFGKISAGNAVYYRTVSAIDGHFETTILNCGQNDMDIKLISSSGLSYQYAGVHPFAEEINLDTLSVCTELSEYIVMEINSGSEKLFLIDPKYSFGADGHCIGSMDSASNVFHICLDDIRVGEYIDEPATLILRPIDEKLEAHELDVVITYSGGYGDVIQGSFSGKLEVPKEIQYDPSVKGYFSVLRK